MLVVDAGVAQLAERQPSKLNVAGSIPVSRSTPSPTALRTPRLVLRPMRADDAGPLLALFGDPGFMAAFDDAQPFGVSEMRGWVERNLVHVRQHGFGLWTIVEAAGGEVIGDCGFEMIRFDGTTLPELGYDLRRDRWGHGLATEAASAALDHGHAVLGFARIVSLVRNGNRRSSRVAERIGMRRAEPVRRDGLRYEVFVSDRRG